MDLIMWSLVLVSKLVTTTKCSSHYNLHLMAGRLAPAYRTILEGHGLPILKWYGMSSCYL
jgi:hypothetical protein